MNKLAINFASLLSNPHVSISLLLMGACELGKIWFPAHVQQFGATQKIFESYAILAATNSGPVPALPAVPGRMIAPENPPIIKA